MNFILELFGIKQCWTNPWKTQELGTLTLCRVKNPHVTHSRPSIYMFWILCVCGSTSSHSTSLTHAIMILLAGENVCVCLVCGAGWWYAHMGVYVYICECIFIHMGVYESVCFWGGDHVCSLTGLLPLCLSWLYYVTFLSSAVLMPSLHLHFRKNWSFLNYWYYR